MIELEYMETVALLELANKLGYGNKITDNVYKIYLYDYLAPPEYVRGDNIQYLKFDFNITKVYEVTYAGTFREISWELHKETLKLYAVKTANNASLSWVKQEELERRKNVLVARANCLVDSAIKSCLEVPTNV